VSRNPLTHFPAACVAALLGFLAALGNGCQRPSLAPRDIVRAGHDPRYDTAYWLALAYTDPPAYESCLLFCAGHPSKPNCRPLRASAFPANAASAFPR
jgi:hypothetical protein